MQRESGAASLESCLNVTFSQLVTCLELEEADEARALGNPPKAVFSKAVLPMLSQPLVRPRKCSCNPRLCIVLCIQFPILLLWSPCPAPQPQSLTAVLRTPLDFWLHCEETPTNPSPPHNHAPEEMRAISRWANVTLETSVLFCSCWFIWTKICAYFHDVQDSFYMSRHFIKLEQFRKDALFPLIHRTALWGREGVSVQISHTKTKTWWRSDGLLTVT